MADRLHEIAAFVEVARQRSFVRAAEQLGLSVSAISRAVAALEARLGVRLLQRSTRRVGLSDAGRAHVVRCEALLAELVDAEAAIAERNTALRGALRASVPSGFGLTHLAPMLPDFLARHPELRLQMHMSNRFVDLIEEGFDVAIRVGALRDSRLVARKLARNHRVLVAAPGYVAAHAALRHPRDLARHACLMLDIGEHPDQWTLLRGGARHTLRVDGPLRSNQVLALRAACEAGLGIGLLPEFALGAALAAGRVVRLLPAWRSAEQGIYAVYPSHRFIPAKVRAFVDFIEGRLRART